MTRWAWGAAALWLVVVGAGAGIAWIAIDQAGRQVIAGGPSISPTPGTAAGTPTPVRTPTRGTHPSATPSQPVATSSPTSRPTSPDTTAPDTATPTRVRTWSGTAGSVRASCTGSTGRVLTATPADGWRAAHDDDGGGLAVRFERGGNEVRVQVSCVGGTPSFRVGTDD